MSQSISHISLSELQSLIKGVLNRGLMSSYWIVAEISELKENYSGHCYLTLTEKGGNNQVPKARANAVIWSSSYSLILSYFRKETGRMLEAGMKVLLRVEVSFHELYGMSLVIKDVDPTYTLGDIELRRQLIIKELQNQGLWDVNREIERPMVMQRIAIISSATAAGYQDFMNELNRNEYGYQFYAQLFNSTMQGSGAEESIIKSLCEVEKSQTKYDVAIIIRGGGAESDLACFDSFDICKEIALMSLPVITGIGHDKDTTIADMVSNLSLKTPTAVAAFFVDSLAEFEDELTSIEDYLEETITSSITNYKETVDSILSRLNELVNKSVSINNLKITAAENTLKHLSNRIIENSGNRLVRVFDQLLEASLRRSNSERNKILIYSSEIKNSVFKLLSQQKSKVDTLAAVTEGYNPTRILQNGYAIARLGSKTIRSKEDVSVGEIIEVTLKDGIIKSEILEIR